MLFRSLGAFGVALLLPRFDSSDGDFAGVVEQLGVLHPVRVGLAIKIKMFVRPGEHVDVKTFGVRVVGQPCVNGGRKV